TYFRDSAFGHYQLLGRQAGDVWEAVAKGEAVVVSTNFVLNLGVGEGETITFETPSGPLQLRIAGVTLDFASPRGTVEMSRDLYKKYWHDNQISRAYVRVLPQTNATVVRDSIARELGNTYSLRILSASELAEYFASQVRRAFAGAH